MSGTKLHLLVVDDAPDSRRTLMRLLQTEGHEVAGADGADATLRILADAPPFDAVLLDWNMPGTTGLELCAELRRRPDTAATHIMMVTGRADSTSLAEALNAGADELVSKPWGHAEMVARLGVLQRRVAASRASVRADLEAAIALGTAEIVLRAADRVGRVFTHDGRIAWVELSSAESLFDLLCRHRPIDADEWRAVVDECRLRNTSLFDALVQWGVAPEDVVRSCVRGAVAERLRFWLGAQQVRSVVLPSRRPYHTDMLFTLEELSLDAPTPPQAAKHLTTMPPPSRGDAKAAVRELMVVHGAQAAAIIDVESSALLAGTPQSPELAEKVRGFARALQSMSTSGDAAELICAAEGSWHIVARCTERGRFAYLRVPQDGPPLAMARLRVQRVSGNEVRASGSGTYNAVEAAERHVP